jgi:hypothetical protein
MIIKHKKNTAFELTIPMIDSATPASFKTGLSPVDTAYYKDGAGSWTALSIAYTFAEIGSTGVYEISLTASEMNHDWVIIKVTASGAADTFVTFKMDATSIDDVDSLITALDAIMDDMAENITGLDSAVAGLVTSVSFFQKAAKVLTNKAVQNKNTGAVNYYDDDGQTVILTHTPSDEESIITRTPS